MGTPYLSYRHRGFRTLPEKKTCCSPRHVKNSQKQVVEAFITQTVKWCPHHSSWASQTSSQWIRLISHTQFPSQLNSLKAWNVCLYTLYRPQTQMLSAIIFLAKLSLLERWFGGRSMFWYLVRVVCLFVCLILQPTLYILDQEANKPLKPAKCSLFYEELDSSLNLEVK